MAGPEGRAPLDELALRWERCRLLLGEQAPGAGGILVFSRLNIYYLGGTLASGVFWLPLSGSPVLLCRKGLDRAMLESPLERIFSFRSYRDLPGLLADAGSPIAGRVAVESGGLSWSLGISLSQHLSPRELVAGDAILARARSVKSEMELALMREAGSRHARCLEKLLPGRIHAGMSEREIAHMIWDIFFRAGHQGILRLGRFGEEVFLGHVSAGDNANYPSVYDGPVGLRGEHPAVPYMGHASRIWSAGEPLTCDVGFCLEGYLTDKTQVYWAGPRSSIPGPVAAAHACCAEISARLAESLRPGAIPGNLHAEALGMARAAGYEEGFMGLYGNKVGFVGHGIGLAIDEYPVLAPGFDEPLVAGMTLAVEPKIGIPGLGMVGLENTFEVTPAGGRCLTGGEPSIICL